MFYWIPNDKFPRFREAVQSIADIYVGICDVYAADMLIVIGRNRSFLADTHFRESFRSSVQNAQESSILWRVHTLAWAATHALNIPGDFVECGVLRGFSSAVLCKYLDFAKISKTFFLYDTFAGLPPETSTEHERNIWNPAYNDDPEELCSRVRQTFSPYPNVKIVRGIVPASFQQAAPDSIAYLHIDMNSVQAELLALEHLFDRVSPGGLIVLDDFGWQCNLEQAQTQVEFMKQRGYSILELPTGQGMVIKR
ncbi:MAG: TylF/MycF/NovP-related O-methyltransferase [Tepidisphaeraceae bacterium]